jgi:hypothetical protein
MNKDKVISYLERNGWEKIEDHERYVAYRKHPRRLGDVYVPKEITAIYMEFPTYVKEMLVSIAANDGKTVEEVMREMEQGEEKTAKVESMKVDKSTEGNK